jgi:hypothetical protein
MELGPGVHPYGNLLLVQGAADSGEPRKSLAVVALLPCLNAVFRLAVQRGNQFLAGADRGLVAHEDAGLVHGLPGAVQGQ